MEFSPTNTTRLHPLLAAAAVSVIVVSVLGAAAITGVLPKSHANAPEMVGASSQTPTTQPADAVSKPVSLAGTVHHSNSPVATAADAVPPTSTPTQRHAAAPKPNSPVGIGIGAVIGGILGSQFGSGDGKTLATVAGAVGGGYVGNEIAKKQNP